MVTMKYTIEVNEEQARLMAEALDLYMRVRLGQIEVIIDPWRFAKRGDGQEQTANHLVHAESLIGEAKMVLTGFTPSASFGIGSSDLPDSAKVAQDMRSVIRHRLAWDRSPDGGHGVDFNDPMKWGSHPLLVITRIEE
jgi:hypothetical protein